MKQIRFYKNNFFNDFKFNEIQKLFLSLKQKILLKNDVFDKFDIDIQKFYIFMFSNEFYKNNKRFPYKKDFLEAKIKKINNLKLDNKIGFEYYYSFISKYTNIEKIYSKEDISKDFYKNEIKKYKLEYGFYPIQISYFKKFLPRSLNGFKIDNNNDIKSFYIYLYGNEEIFNKFYYQNELLNIINSENKKRFEFNEIKTKERKILLFLFEYYKFINKKYPDYKDIKKTYYFPLIIGLEEREDIIYKNLFKNNEIEEFINKNDLIILFKKINNETKLENTEEIEDNKIIKEQKSKIAEKIILKITNNLFVNKSNEIDETILDNNELEIYKNDTNFFIQNIDNILFLTNYKKTQNTKQINDDYELIDLNDIQMNYKGYDFLLQNGNTKTFLNYKFKKGRTIASLSLNKFTDKEKQNLLKIVDIEFIEKIDNQIFEYFLKEIIEEKFSRIIKSINNDEINQNKNFLENINEIIENNYLFLTKNKEIKLIKIDESIKMNIDTKKFQEQILKIISFFLIKNVTKNKIKNKNKLNNNKDEIFKYICKKIIESGFLKHSFLQSDESQSQNQYKYIIKVIYRNNKIIDYIKRINNEDTYDNIIYESVLPYFLKEFKEIEKNTRNNNKLKLKILDSILNFKEEESFIIDGTGIYENLKLRTITKNIKDIHIEFSNFKSVKTGINFDTSIKYKKEEIYNIKDNFIKSQSGKFMFFNSVQFSTNLYINNQIISNLNNSSFLELKNNNSKNYIEIKNQNHHLK